jgi:hypothetical protein
MSNLVVQTWDRGIDAENGATAPTEEFYRTTAFFPIVDNVIHEMERRVNDEETLPLKARYIAEYWRVSFSSMRKIRTYFRSTTGERRMISIALLNTESEMATNVDLDQVVDIFAKLPSLRYTGGELNAANVRRLDL